MVEGGVHADVEPRHASLAMRASIRGQASDVEGPKAQVAVAGAATTGVSLMSRCGPQAATQESVVTLERTLGPANG